MFVIVFLISAMVEIVVAAYTFAVAHGQTRKAIISSGLATFARSAVIMGFVQDPFLILAVVLGDMLGTWIFMQYFYRTGEMETE